MQSILAKMMSATSTSFKAGMQSMSMTRKGLPLHRPFATPAIPRSVGCKVVAPDVAWNAELNKVQLKGKMLEDLRLYNHKDLKFCRGRMQLYQRSDDKCDQVFHVEVSGPEVEGAIDSIHAGDDVYVEGSIVLQRLQAPGQQREGEVDLPMVIIRAYTLTKGAPPVQRPYQPQQQQQQGSAPQQQGQRYQGGAPQQSSPPAQQQQQAYGSGGGGGGYGNGGGYGGAAAQPPQQQQRYGQQQAPVQQAPPAQQRYGSGGGAYGRSAPAAAAAPAQGGGQQQQVQQGGGQQGQGGRYTPQQAGGQSGLPDISGLAAATPEEKWRFLAANPNAFFDNRITKRSPKGPDFKLKGKDVDVALWIDSRDTPDWAKQQFALQQQPQQ